MISEIAIAPAAPGIPCATKNDRNSEPVANPEPMQVAMNAPPRIMARFQSILLFCMFTSPLCLALLYHADFDDYRVFAERALIFLTMYMQAAAPARRTTTVITNIHL